MTRKNGVLYITYSQLKAIARLWAGRSEDKAIRMIKQKYPNRKICMRSACL